jgi:hypothetical protein
MEPGPRVAYHKSARQFNAAILCHGKEGCCLHVDGKYTFNLIVPSFLNGLPIRGVDRPRSPYR